MFMVNKKVVAGYQLFFGSLALIAVATQFTLSITANPNFNPVNFFSFFTIESNIVAALVFIITSIRHLTGKDTANLTLWHGAAALYMTITGIVYITLLSGLEESLNTPTPWVNVTLHYIFPVIAFLDWFIDRPIKHVTFKQSLIWIVFPVLYLIYSLVRGIFTNWYPYPFLNPATGGYGQVAVVSVSIAVLGLVACALFALASGKGEVKKRGRVESR